MTFEAAVNKPFEVDPEEIWYYLIDRFIPAIKGGESALIERFLPFLERSAIARLKGIGRERIANEPHRIKDFDRWRAAWVAHVRPSQNFRFDPVFDAAVNVLIVADDLRAALATGASELAAALAMQLVCEVLRGGAEIEAHDLRVKAQARSAHFKSTLGARHRDYSRAEKGCVQVAAFMWNSDPSLRIGAVAKACQDRLKEATPEQFPALERPPTLPVIKAWLKAANDRGELSIPQGASRRGRPKGQQ